MTEHYCSLLKIVEYCVWNCVIKLAIATYRQVMLSSISLKPSNNHYVCSSEQSTTVLILHRLRINNGYSLANRWLNNCSFRLHLLNVYTASIYTLAMIAVPAIFRWRLFDQPILMCVSQLSDNFCKKACSMIYWSNT